MSEIPLSAYAFKDVLRYVLKVFSLQSQSQQCGLRQNVHRFIGVSGRNRRTNNSMVMRFSDQCLLARFAGGIGQGEILPATGSPLFFFFRSLNWWRKSLITKPASRDGNFYGHSYASYLFQCLSRSPARLRLHRH